MLAVAAAGFAPVPTASGRFVPLVVVRSRHRFLGQRLLFGGISYTLGAVVYSINKIKLNHAIFHVFVLIGSICHFVSVYYYVLPR